jgi:uncharacterized NAD(P)/FAD-binding protein YdhS
MPQEAATKIHSMRWSGRLLNHSGRIVEARIENDSRFRVRVALRGGRDDLSLEVARVINCTGPSSNLRNWPHSLIHDLMESGIVRTDPLGQGLLTDNDGALIGQDGAQSNVVFTLGPMRRGTLLETTAIPEIREQAAGLARRVLAQISSTPLRQQASDLIESLAAGGD